MQVSVIIPAYKAEAHIVRSVKSLLLQTHSDFEVIISADDEQDYAAVLARHAIADARISHVSTGGIGKGPATARNCALKAAHYDMIMSLDADDSVEPDYIEIMLPLARQYGAAISQVRFIDESTGADLPNMGMQFKSQILSLEKLYSACVHTYTSIMFNKNIVQACWNEEIRLLEDSAFLAELCNALGGVWYNNIPLYHYHHHASSSCNEGDAAQRFLEAGMVIRRLLAEDRVCTGNKPLQNIMQAYLARNDTIEEALKALALEGNEMSYQAFIRQNPAMLHTPLV